MAFHYRIEVSEARLAARRALRISIEAGLGFKAVAIHHVALTAAFDGTERAQRAFSHIRRTYAGPIIRAAS
jgi:hypothetical protein